MVQWVKLLLVTSALYVSADWNPGCFASDQLPANWPGKAAEDDPGAWVHATHVRALDGVPGSCFSLAQAWLLWPFEE